MSLYLHKKSRYLRGFWLRYCSRMYITIPAKDRRSLTARASNLSRISSGRRSVKNRVIAFIFNFYGYSIFIFIASSIASSNEKEPFG